MNNIILNLLAKGSPAATPPAAAPAGSPGALPSVELFRAALGGQLTPKPAAPKATAAPAAESPTAAAIQKKIAALMAAGASQADVIAALASQLAGTVAQTIDAPGVDERAKLQTVFARALAPPGVDDDAGGSIAERARTLAHRYIKVAATATAIAAPADGQQKRFSGKLLDARRAKDIPAPTTSGTTPLPALPASVSAPAATSVAPPIAHAAATLPAAHAPGSAAAAAGPAPRLAHPTDTVRAQILPSLEAPDRAMPAPAATLPAAAATTPAPAAASAAPASPDPASPAPDPVPSAPLAVPVTVAPPAGGDGKRVDLGAATPIAAGGDTLLGRVLTRASLAADARRPADVSAARAPAPAPAAADVRPAGAKPAAATPAEAFIKSFEAALHAAVDPDAQVPVAAAAPPSLAAAHAAPDTAGALSAAAPLQLDRPAPAPPAEAAAAPAPPVDHSAIADQVLRGAFLRNTGESSEMRLTLVPETLGDVSVKLIVNAGNVTAHVVAETPEVRDALVAAQPQLTKSLAEAGLKLTGFSVDLAGGFAGFAQQQDRSPQGNRQPARAFGIEDPGESDDDAALEAVPSFGPSAASRAAGDYNYLV